MMNTQKRGEMLFGRLRVLVRVEIGTKIVNILSTFNIPETVLKGFVKMDPKVLE
jgi:phage terminase Nu1 subunit (DNA packaging protein)